MQIYLASDHAGFELKNSLVAFLKTRGDDVEDLGPHALQPQDDYPDFIFPLAKKVVQEKTAFGIIIGASGQGEAIAANRVKGVRAAVFYGGNLDIVRLAREHNDSNILALGARFVAQKDAEEAVTLWLATPFSGEERHIRRIAKLDHD